VELWGFRDDGHELLAPVAGVVDVEPEEAGRVAVAESAEEFGVGGEAAPSLGNEGGGEAEAEQDLVEVEQVVVADDICHRGLATSHSSDGAPGSSDLGEISGRPSENLARLDDFGLRAPSPSEQENRLENWDPKLLRKPIFFFFFLQKFHGTFSRFNFLR
jgi:hypothetical protein